MNVESIFQWDKKKRLIHKMTHTKARMTMGGGEESAKNYL